MKKETKSVGWQFSIDVLSKFQEYCDSVNDSYGDAASAAMVVWQYLPPSIQRAAQLEANGIPAIDKQFWEDLRAGLEQATLEQVRNQAGKQGKK